MALIKKAVDTVNKRVQFEVMESCTGISYTFDKLSNEAVISVILLEENEPNKILYKGQNTILTEILGFRYTNVMSFLPFAIDADLNLSTTKKILVEFDLSGITVENMPTEIQYETVFSPVTTQNPLEIKVIDANGENIDLSTQNYKLLRSSFDAIHVLNAHIVKTENGKTFPKSIRYPQEYLNSLADSNFGYVSLVFPFDTKLNVNGNGSIYLVKF